MKYTLSHHGREYSATFKKNLRRYINFRNFVAKAFFRKIAPVKSSLKELNEIREKALTGTDISDHLEILFIESMAARPKLIVELGTRTGESTFVFERVAKLADAFLLSVDIEPQLAKSSWTKWSFVQADDIALADQFKEWCLKKGVQPDIDVLFIDTDHEYEHTKKEIAKWFPFLSNKAVVFFHDANVKMIYKRRNGTVGKAYDDDRDVMRAIEEYVGARFNENKDFTEIANGWLVRHYAICNGMTILSKVKV